MVISDEQVMAVARLARIAIDDASRSELAKELSRIVDFVQQMDKIDTEGVAPLHHPLELDARLRSDLVVDSNQRDTYQAGAPRVERGLYLVPKVIE